MLRLRSLRKDVKQYNKDRSENNVWYRILTVLASVVVFVTTYALILPAITMDADSGAMCGLVSHTHTDECLDEFGNYICGYEYEHEHDMQCFSNALTLGTYSCGFEYQHTHAEKCYKDGVLTCTLQEHTHDETCIFEPAISPALVTPIMTMSMSPVMSAGPAMAPRSMMMLGSPLPPDYSDLGNFVTSYKILHPEDDPASTPSLDTVYVGERYKIVVYFSEDNSAENYKQFENDTNGQLTYSFPVSANLSLSPTASQSISIDDSLYGHQVVGHFSIDDSGNLIVVYDAVDNSGSPTSNGEKYFELYKDTVLFVEFSVIVNDTEEGDTLEINLQNDVKINVQKKNETELNVNKTFNQYQQSTHKAMYTVDVQCAKGAVSNLSFNDIATLVDKNSGVVYDSNSNKFSYENMLIYDINADFSDPLNPPQPILDSNGDPITDLSTLATEYPILRGGEGYKIVYTIDIDDDLISKYSTYSLEMDNEFVVNGLDPNGIPVSASDSKNPRFNYNNIHKTGSPTKINVGGDLTDVIAWDVTVGDYMTDISGKQLIDILDCDKQHFLKSEGVFIQILAPTTARNNGVKYDFETSVGSTVYFDEGSSPEKMIVTLPTNPINGNAGTLYSLRYYTVYDESDRSFSNSVQLVDANGTDSWNDSNSANVVSEKPVITKTVSSVDSEYLYYTLTAVFPAGKKGTNYYIEDKLVSNGGYLNEPEMMEVKVYNHSTGETTTLAPYDEGDSVADMYRLIIHGEAYLGEDDAGRSTFYISFAEEKSNWSRPISVLNSHWPYNDQTTVTVSYKIPRNSPKAAIPSSEADSTIYTIDYALLESREIKNTASVKTVWTYLSTSPALYHETTPISKKGNVTNNERGIIEYKVPFLNSVLPSEKTDWNWDRVPIINNDVSDAVFHDEFDDKTEYVDGSLYAYLYYFESNKSLTTDFGQSFTLRGVMKYSGSDISGNSIDAKFSDFIPYDYSSDFPSLSKTDSNNYCIFYNSAYVRYRSVNYENLLQLLQSTIEDTAHTSTGNYRAQFQVVFVYETQVKDELRQTLNTGSEAILNLVNEADFDVEYNSGGTKRYGPAQAVVPYDTSILSKEHTDDLINGDTIGYTITLNPYGYDLTEQEYFTLTDTMCEDLDLYLGTVEIQIGNYDAVTSTTTWTAYTGNPELSYDPVSHVLSVKVPDNAPIKITYNCKILKTGNVSLYNTVNVAGFIHEVKQDLAEFTVNASSSSGGGTNGNMYLRKNDSENHTALSGAVFALYGPYDTSSLGDYVADGVPETITVYEQTLYYYRKFITASNPSNPVLDGTFLIDQNTDNLKYHSLYSLRELVPPTGYDLPLSVDNAFYWKEAPTSNPIPGVPVYYYGSTMYVENSRTAVELPSTGGSGSEIFLMLGVGLVAISVSTAFILIKRRSYSH